MVCIYSPPPALVVVMDRY